MARRIYCGLALGAIAASQRTLGGGGTWLETLLLLQQTGVYEGVGVSRFFETVGVNTSVEWLVRKPRERPQLIPMPSDGR